MFCESDALAGSCQNGLGTKGLWSGCDRPSRAATTLGLDVPPGRNRTLVATRLEIAMSTSRRC